MSHTKKKMDLPITRSKKGRTALPKERSLSKDAMVRSTASPRVSFGTFLVMMGYLLNREATLKSFDPNGFFHTGDQGHFEEHGNLVITGRIKDLISFACGIFFRSVVPVQLLAAVRTLPQHRLKSLSRNSAQVSHKLLCVEMAENISPAW